MEFAVASRTDEPDRGRALELERIKSGAYCEGALSYELSHVANMMRSNELRLLRHIAQHCVQPGQQIVDAGVFVGASTIALGDGLARRADAERFWRAVHSYDRFMNSSDFYNRLFHDTVEPGGSFLPIFLRNIEHHARFVNIYPGDFNAFRWIGLPIGLFFCDIAKTWQVNAHVYREFSPSWVPGETIFIQQDFVHAEAPWVQVVLGFLLDHFNFLAQETPSLALVFASTIPDWKLERIQRNDFTLSDQLEAIERLVGLPLDLEAKLTLRILAAKIQTKAGNGDAAKAILADVKEASGEIDDPHFGRRLKKAEDALEV